jgi:RND family efflux transporter MFP subunit
MHLSKRRSWLYVGGVLVGLVLLLAAILGVRELSSSPATAQASEPSPALPASEVPRVETIRPTQGGLAKRTAQPGSAHSFESAELFAKVSGFLKEQRVDIGSRVQRGDLLAEIDVPELTEDVTAAAAALKQAEAELTQAEAHVESAAADHKASQAKIAQMAADVQRCEAEVGLAQKQYDRMRELNELKGIEDRIVEERLCQLQSAQAAQRASQSAVSAAEQQAAAAAAKIALAKAEVVVSQAKVTVARSALERAKVLVSYTKIVSPYDGVVTCRNFHPGAFVRSPDHGGQVPLLTVDRVDKMRVVVQIPERDVPFIQPGDKATIHFDALPQRKFEGSVSRIAESEEPASRTMRAEIDLPNPDGLIRDHMFGRVEISLEEPLEAVTIPSACLVGEVSGGQARLFVVAGDEARLQEVKIGRDTGVEVEILSGVSLGDQVVLRPPGGLLDGAKVASRAASTGAAAH